MDVVLILYLALLVVISFYAGARSGKEIDLLRTDAPTIGLKVAAAIGITTACLTIVMYLYAYYAISSGSVNDGQPRPLIPVLSSAILLCLETGTATGILAGVVSILAQRITIRRMGDRLKSGHCYGCGYDLTGNVSGQCPECGRGISRGPGGVA
jgi:uncharacterized membrane protein